VDEGAARRDLRRLGRSERHILMTEAQLLRRVKGGGERLPAAVAERSAHGELLARRDDRVGDAHVQRQPERERQRAFERLRVTDDAKELRAVTLALCRRVAFGALFQ